MTQLQAIIQTTSNFKNCNGQKLTVVQIFGQTVVCLVPRFGFYNGLPNGDVYDKADFKLNEIAGFSNIEFEK